MEPPSSGLTLDIPAEASNVAVVRHALSGLAQSIGMDDEGVADVQTVVTEACMNSVIHAYPEGGGRIEVLAVAEPEHLLIEVRDEGRGIRPELGVRNDGSSLRLGLTLIAALSASYEVSGGDGQGTRVAVRMPIARGSLPPPTTDVSSGGMKDLRISAASPALLPEVMSRVISAFGVRCNLSVDRISDAMLLGDAIAAAAPDAFGEANPELGLRAEDAGVEVSIGPLPEGGVERLREGLRLPGVGSIESLVDEVRADRGDDGVYVVFRLGGGPA